MIASDLSTSSVYFNPRPRKEGDLAHVKNYSPERAISIHALAKRATRSIGNVIMDFPISIHALAKRATSDASVTS